MASLLSWKYPTPPKYTVPPGVNFFAHIKHNYDTVPLSADGKVGTMAFVEATADFIQMFAITKSTTFSVCYGELHQNIEKVRKFFLANPMTADTLDGLVDEEEKQKPRSKEAQLGLLWLFFGLDNAARAIAILLQNLGDWKNSAPGAGTAHTVHSIELPPAFTYAYKFTLYRIHGYTARSGYTFALSKAPGREEFLKLLGDDRQKLIDDGRKWYDGIAKILEALRPLVEVRVAKNVGVSIAAAGSLTDEEKAYNDIQREGEQLVEEEKLPSEEQRAARRGLREHLRTK